MDVEDLKYIYTQKQITFEDIENQASIQSMPNRTAYIDESGNFGFDFSALGTSKYYILCAVIVENHELNNLHETVEKVKRNVGYPDSELKSSKIGNNYARRSHIISKFLDINFRVILLIADKQKFLENSPLTQYKDAFIKYLHQRLYDALYHVYPKLKIIQDEEGTTEFQNSFKHYVERKRPQINFLNEYDFDYCDSKDEVLVQLADVVGGSIYHSLNDDNSPPYREILKGKILFVDFFPNKREPYWGAISPDARKYDSRIYLLAEKCATDFIEKFKGHESNERRAQVAFLRYLLFEVKSINPTHYVSSKQLLSAIGEYIGHTKERKNFLYRSVVARLRDEGVIIASCAHGYKIPVSAEDITTYLNQTHTIVYPMLHRIEICRNLIAQETMGEFDILEDAAFLKYKKFFD